jgi:hypothetical protein
MGAVRELCRFTKGNGHAAADFERGTFDIVASSYACRSTVVENGTEKGLL